MPVAGSEEVMRLKNELAIQRALRIQKNKEANVRYKPSVNALKEYTPFTKVFDSHDNDENLRPPTERYVPNRALQNLDCYQPQSARNIVSEQAL